MSLSFGDRVVQRASDLPINDGQWHHVIAEVERGRAQGIRIYVDGKLHNGAWSGTMDVTTSLSNKADFLVGKGVVLAGATNDHATYFAGQVDFLRIARGTLADAETTIEELYRWEFDGPFLKDFDGRGRSWPKG